MTNAVIKCESVYKIFGANAKKCFKMLMEMLMQKHFKKMDV
jgi:ABC-type proline/glycine betaine transport system ATPase subunit